MMSDRQKILGELAVDLVKLRRIELRGGDGFTPHEIELHREELLAEADRQLAELPKAAPSESEAAFVE